MNWLVARLASRNEPERGSNVTVVNETGYAIKFLGFNAPDDGLDEWDNELDKVLQNQASTYGRVRRGRRGFCLEHPRRLAAL